MCILPVFLECTNYVFQLCTRGEMTLYSNYVLGGAVTVYAVL